MKNHNTLLFVLLFVFAVALAVPAQSKTPTEFSAESRIVKSIEIPNYVMRSIRQTEDNLSSEAEFEGALINLDDDGKPDFLVQGDSGTNTTGFWFFRNVGGKYKMVLAVRAHDLKIETSKTKNLKDIGSAAMSAVMLWETEYKFDGVKYVAKICTELDMQQNTKRKPIPCKLD